MNIDEFCLKIHELDLSNVEKAIAIIWYYDRISAGEKKKAVELSKIIFEHGLGNPNQTALAKLLRKSGLLIESAKGFSLKTTTRSSFTDRLAGLYEKKRPKIDHSVAYLPSAVWEGTRNYVEKIAVQINGCFENEYWDGASVLMRRLLETLLIESYEYLKRENEIKKDNEYRMLGPIIAHATGSGGLPIGRDTKRFLNEVKTAGDRSAHNRYYTAVKADLTKLQSDFRLAIDELIQLSNLRKSPA